MIDDSKIARRLPIAMRPHAFVNGGEVIEHLVRAVDTPLSDSGDARERSVVRSRRSGYRPRSLAASTVAAPSFRSQVVSDVELARNHRRSDFVRRPQYGRFLPSARFRSRMDGSGGRARLLRAHHPAQRTLFCSHCLLQQQQPFQKASGRGGQPGT